MYISHYGKDYGDVALKTNDFCKREAGALIGIALTEVGATWYAKPRRITWPFIGRYFACGGGLLATLAISEVMVWKGYRKAGYQFGIVASAVTVALASVLNYTPVGRVFIIGGAGMVFANHWNRLAKLGKQSAE